MNIKWILIVSLVQVINDAQFESDIMMWMIKSAEERILCR